MTLILLSVVSWLAHTTTAQSYKVPSYAPARPYHFEYEISDDKSGDYHGHKETQNEDGSVTGSYFLLSPDGLWRQTKYSDQGYGFQAVTNTFPYDTPPKQRAGTTYTVFQSAGSDFEPLPNDVLGRPAVSGAFDIGKIKKPSQAPAQPLLPRPGFGSGFPPSPVGSGAPLPIFGGNNAAGVSLEESGPNLGAGFATGQNVVPPALLGQKVNVGFGANGAGQEPFSQSSGFSKFSPNSHGPAQNILSGQGIGVPLLKPNSPPAFNSENEFQTGPLGDFNQGLANQNNQDAFNSGVGLGFDGSGAGGFPQFQSGTGEAQGTFGGSPLPLDFGGVRGSHPPNKNQIGNLGDITGNAFAQNQQPNNFGTQLQLNQQNPSFNQNIQAGSADFEAQGPLPGQNFLPPLSGTFGGPQSSLGRPLSATSSQVPIGSAQNSFLTSGTPETALNQQGVGGNFNANSFNGNIPDSNGNAPFGQTGPSIFTQQSNGQFGNFPGNNINPGVGLPFPGNQGPNSAQFFNGQPSGLPGQFQFGPQGDTGNFGENPGFNPAADLGPGFDNSLTPGNQGPNNAPFFNGQPSNSPGGFQPGSQGGVGSFGGNQGLNPAAELGTGLPFENSVAPGNLGPNNAPFFNGQANGFPGEFELGPQDAGSFGGNQGLDPAAELGTGLPLDNSLALGNQRPNNGPSFNGQSSRLPGEFPPGPQLGGSSFGGNQGFNPDAGLGPRPGGQGNSFGSAGFTENLGTNQFQQSNSEFGPGFDTDFVGGQNGNFGASPPIGSIPIGTDLTQNPNLGNNFQFAQSQFGASPGLPSGGVGINDPRVGPQGPLNSFSPRNRRTKASSNKRSTTKQKVTREADFKLNTDSSAKVQDNPKSSPQDSAKTLRSSRKTQAPDSRPSASSQRISRVRNNRDPKNLVFPKATGVTGQTDSGDNFPKGFSDFDFTSSRSFNAKA
ncbi:Cuticle Protein CPR RR Uncl [Hyalella azteca]|nr:Cuticle Protein CPR RR Uncl [Hyalella azteca]